MTNTSLAIPGLGQFGPRGEVSDVRQTRSTFLQLQALVTVVLSYQVLFTPEHMVQIQDKRSAEKRGRGQR